MSKEKACKECKTIYRGNKCPECGSTEGVEGFKGRMYIFDSEQSEIAKNIGIKKKGVFAVKLR